MRSSSYLRLACAALCAPLLLLSGCGDKVSAGAGGAAAPESSAKASTKASDGADLIIITIRGQDTGNADDPSCAFSFEAENRGKETLTAMLDFEPIHAQTGDVITASRTDVQDVIFSSVAPGQSGSNIMPKAISEVACADVKLKPIKSRCMGDCTFQWKAEGFGGML